VENFVRLLSELPAWAWVVLVGLVILLCCLVVAAFVQGREISFWPPRIGPRQPAMKDSEGQEETSDAASHGSNDAGEVTSQAAPVAARGATRSPALDTWERHAIVDHDRLFGVERLISDVAEVVRATTGGISLVSLSGDGGIGKTTVAYEVTMRLTNGDFSRIAWASARNARFGAIGQASASSGVQSADMLKSIADQLGFDVGLSRALWETEFAARLRTLDSDERVLAVVDNIESLDDAASLPQYLESLGLVRPHKVLVTTRWSLQDYAAVLSEFPVISLEPGDALALVAHLGRNDPSLSSANADALAPLLRVTEGNPFLIKIAVSHYMISHRSLDQVLHELTDLSTSTGLGQRLNEHLYLRSLTELERRRGEGPTRSLMSAFCATDIGDSLSYEELAQDSGLETEQFRQVLEDACRLALVRSSELNRRYSIHSLLYEFTCRQV
jgi:hypothetical protein